MEPHGCAATIRCRRYKTLSDFIPTRPRHQRPPGNSVSRSHTDFSRVERVDRVESIAPIDAKRPYSTLMFKSQRTQRSQRKNSVGSLTISCQIKRFPDKITIVKGVSPRNFHVSIGSHIGQTIGFYDTYCHSQAVLASRLEHAIAAVAIAANRSRIMDSSICLVPAHPAAIADA